MRTDTYHNRSILFPGRQKKKKGSQYLHDVPPNVFIHIIMSQRIDKRDVYHNPSILVLQNCTPRIFQLYYQNL